MGEGRKKAKESQVVPHPKLNPVCATGCEFDSWTLCRRITTLGKLFTHMCLCHQPVSFGTSRTAVMLSGWEGDCRPGGK